jgi:phage/plasmid-like protein (TIGR03299 family)
MSHELTMRDDGTVEMAYVGERPWHGLGTKLPEGTPVAEWIGAAGMEWTVEQSPVEFMVGDEKHSFPDRFVLHRSDNHLSLGVVSSDYCILNPAECLQFFDDLVTSVGLSLETAGTMFGGKRFWALARIGEQAMIDNHDRIKGYLLLSSSADGLRATEARHTSIRVVCRNTLRMSDMKDAEGQVKISHRSQFVAENVKRKLGIAPKTFETFMENMRRLADVRMSDAKAETMTRKLLGKDEEKTGKRFEKVMELFRGAAVGSELPGVQGTAWGWLNSVTEAVDHHAKSKSDARKLDSILFGAGEKLKATALGQALELVA